MKPFDIALATGVAVIWGLGFLASRLALDELSPTLMTALRFVIAALPCLFVRKPDVSWGVLISISIPLFLGQFLAQAFGIAHGVPVGLTSVIVQSQALFTVAFAVIAFREMPRPVQIAGMTVAVAGMVLICCTVGTDFSVTAFAVLMISPVSFAVGNLMLRRARHVPMFDLFSWLCLVSALPMLGITTITDGPQQMWREITHVTPIGIACLFILGAVATSLCFWAWGGLLRDYTAAQIVPFALLIPIIGAIASHVVFGEQFAPLRLAGMLVMVCGIAIMLLSPRPPALVEVG
jgi:O-acetylserine/cysteine efflux transporter